MNDVDWLTDSARLQALIAVAESGSFTAAARRLDVSQPTVSTLIAALERRIGTRLFDRSRSAVVATAAGNALIPRARELLVIAEQAAHAIDASVSPGRKHLSVAGGQALVTYTLPPALADLRTVLPGLTADVIVGDEARVVAAVRSGEAACGLVTDRTDPRDLVVEAYAEDRLVAIVSPDHRLAGASTGLAALRDETLVSRDRVNVDRREIERLLTSAKITPGARLVVSSLEAAKQCVAAGLGIAFVPGISAVRDLARGDLAEVHIDAPLPAIGYHLVYRRGDGTADLTGRLLQSLRATSRRLP